MKKAILLIFLVSFYFISSAQDEWTLIHPFPTLSNYNDAHFNSANEGWVIAYGGKILYTNDGCETWEFQHDNDDETFRSIFFIDDNEGWVGGYNRMYHTTDKGATWERQGLGNRGGDIADVFFINQDTGWAVGYYKIMYKTTNGGENWNRVTINIEGEIHLSSVVFTDELHGCAVGKKSYILSEGFIMITSDGGATWTETTPETTHQFKKVLFIDDSIGFVGGYHHGLLKTYDGGQTWNDIFCYGSTMDMLFFDETNGVVLSGSSVYLTFDAGETWDSCVYIAATSSQRSLTSWDNEKIISVGGYGSVSKSLDGGSSWESLNNGIAATLKQIGFFNSLDGIATTGYWGNDGLVRTIDGGYSWSNDTLIENGPFYKMYMEGSHCYLLNDSSQMMKSLNNGEDWELLDVPSDTSYYKDFQFVNENTGYMCSADGILVKTIDGGHTWIDKTLDGNFVLNYLFFVNDTLGWMLDYQARVVLRTINGGDDWSFAFLGDVYLFEPQSVFFINENEGFATTDEGVLFKSINGGETWEEFYVFSYGADSEIYFINDVEGWYRNRGGIYHTYDGGISWTAPQGLGAQLKGMYFMDNQGWLCGSYGLVGYSSFTVNIPESIENNTSVSVFPNPAHNDVEIKLHDVTDNIIDIKVFNLHGQKVKHFTNLSEANTFKFNVSGLAGGAYVVHVTSANSENLVKFIVQ